jgi:hypothetical protein
MSGSTEAQRAWVERVLGITLSGHTFLKDLKEKDLKTAKVRLKPLERDAYQGAQQKASKEAHKQYDSESKADANFSTKAAPGPPAKLQPFDVGALQTVSMRQKLDAPNSTDADIKAIGDALATAIKRSFLALPPDSDQRFDLSLKNTSDLKAALAAAMTWPFEPPNDEAPETRKTHKQGFLGTTRTIADGAGPYRALGKGPRRQNRGTIVSRGRTKQPE